MRQYIFTNDPILLQEIGKKVIYGTDGLKAKAFHDRMYQYQDCYYMALTAYIVLSLVISGDCIQQATRRTAELCGCALRTVYKWLKIADITSFNGILPKTKHFRKCVLDNTQKAQIADAINHNPTELHLPFNVWTGSTLSEYIANEFKISYSVRSCQNLFRELGFSLIRPQVFPCFEEASEERISFVQNLINTLEDDSCILTFEDEVHFCQQSTITRQWYRKGSEPRIHSPAGKKAAGYFGFVMPESGELYTVASNKFTWETTIQALESMLIAHPAPEGKHYVIVMDNAPWHRKAIRLIREDKEYKSIREQVEFLFMPPHSPDLNPIEQVWRLTRREKTHNRYFSSLDKLTETLECWFTSLSVPNDKLQKLCSFNWEKKLSKLMELAKKKKSEGQENSESTNTQKEESDPTASLAENVVYS